MRIYLTHCSAKKDDSLRDGSTKVSPDVLYTARPTQRFMGKCKLQGVTWAIFSDLYGVWFPDVRHAWYEKDPNTVAEFEFKALLSDFDGRLQGYDEIWFYYNPGRFHPLYRRLISESSLANRITRFTHLEQIV